MTLESRRKFLATMGIAGLGALVAPHAYHTRAVAQPAAPPKRLVLLMSSFGTVDGRWRMNPHELPTNAPFQFDLGDLPAASFSEILGPLHRVRQHITVAEGFSQLVVPFGRVGSIHAIGHAPSGAITATGGAWSVPDSEASEVIGNRRVRSHHPSIDQIVAAATRGSGRLPSLELGRDGWRFDTSGSGIPGEESPRVVFDRLFPEAPSSTAEPDGGRERALTLVADELDAIAARVGSYDASRLEQQRRLVLELRDRLAFGASASCERPTLAGDVHTDFFTLIATAFACDLTRVVSYKIGALGPREFGEPAGVSVHQDLAHRENNDPSSDGSRRIARMYAAIATRFRELVELLAAVPEPTAPGDTLLDHTLLVWMTEQENGEHDYRKVPFVFAGRCGGAIRTGRYLYYPRELTLTRNSGSRTRTETWYRGHNHVHVSIAQAMGVSTDVIGLPEIVDLEGRRVSLRGGLPELLAG